MDSLFYFFFFCFFNLPTLNERKIRSINSFPIDDVVWQASDDFNRQRRPLVEKRVNNELRLFLKIH